MRHTYQRRHTSGTSMTIRYVVSDEPARRRTVLFSGILPGNGRPRSVQCPRVVLIASYVDTTERLVEGRPLRFSAMSYHASYDALPIDETKVYQVWPQVCLGTAAAAVETGRLCPFEAFWMTAFNGVPDPQDWFPLSPNVDDPSWSPTTLRFQGSGLVSNFMHNAERLPLVPGEARVDTGRALIV